MLIPKSTSWWAHRCQELAIPLLLVAVTFLAHEPFAHVLQDRMLCCEGPSVARDRRPKKVRVRVEVS